jgi:hypothetical protein
MIEQKVIPLFIMSSMSIDASRGVTEANEESMEEGAVDEAVVVVLLVVVVTLPPSFMLSRI